MSTFKERMVQEVEELADKVAKLQDFIENNVIFESLPSNKQVLMEIQLLAMQQYLTVLNERVMLEE